MTDIHVVRRSLYFRPVIDDDRLGIPGMVLLRYSNAFPFAVRLFFPDTPQTQARAVEVRRDVLAEGIDFHGSDSDVTVQHLRSGQVEIALNDGSLRVVMPRDALIDALKETWGLVEKGHEFDVFDVDVWLNRELGRAA